MSKFREFWIKPAYKPEDEDRISFCKVPKNDFEHVIEYAALAAKDAEIEKLREQLEKEERSCLQIIDERDFRENQINEIADLLGDHREWSSQNDRGENCIESIEQLKKQLEVCRAALEFYAQKIEFGKLNDSDLEKAVKIEGRIIYHECDPPTHSLIWVYGKRARQAIAELEKMK